MMMNQSSKKLRRLTSQMMSPPTVRRLGEENEDVAIIIDSGADVALFPLSMADHGERVAIQHKDPATRCATKSYPHTRCEKC